MTTLPPPCATCTPWALRLGTDMVWIPSVRDSVQQFGERYLRRIFTPQELAYCTSSSGSSSQATVRVERLAARFAAKEAVMKLLRPDANTAIPWTSIEITSSTSGVPEIRLSGAAAAQAHATGLHNFALSMSHDHDYATATAVTMTPT